MENNNQNIQSNNLDKFNLMIEQATNMIACDSTCQQQKTANELKTKYLNSQTNLATAPNQYELAKKNYLIYSQGQSSYNEQVDNELTQKAKKLSLFYKENFNKESANILSSINSYSGLLVNLNNVSELLAKYKNENEKLSKQIKKESNDILTNERKTYYQDEGIENLKFYYYYFLVTIYFICLAAFGIFNFIYPSQFSFNMRIFIFVLLFILPFISTWILGKLIFLFYSAYEVLPKNVHTKL